MMNKKQFDRLRLAFTDRLRRDGNRSLAERTVGAEIAAHVNFVTGDAWPSADYLAKKLSLGIRTVKRAIMKLRCIGTDGPYFFVTRTGRFNRYRPNFELVGQTALLLESAEVSNATGAKNDQERCQIGTTNGAKKDPLSLLNKSHISPQSRAADDGARLRDQRGDEKLEFEAAKLLGENGYEILTKLHEIDHGQPRLRLLALVRGGKVTQDDIDAAKDAAWWKIQEDTVAAGRGRRKGAA